MGGRLTQDEIEKMLEEADKYKEEDDLTLGEMAARENLKLHLHRARKALEETRQSKIPKGDRGRLEKTAEEVQEWMESRSTGATKEEVELKQKELESAMNTIMLRINLSQTDFWEQKLDIPVGEKTIANGGCFLESGLDIRLLMDGPD